MRCIREGRWHLNGICAVVVVPRRIRGSSSVVVALVLRCLNLRRAIANLTEQYGWVRSIENDQAFNTAWIGRSKHPSSVTTPVIAHQDAPLTAEMPKQGMYIAQQSWHGIGIDCIRLIRWRKTSQIGSHHHMVSTKLRELARVKRPGVWGAVQKQHELALAPLDKV